MKKFQTFADIITGFFVNHLQGLSTQVESGVLRDGSLSVIRATGKAARAPFCKMFLKTCSFSLGWQPA
jgi:hypothetical protein